MKNNIADYPEKTYLGPRMTCRKLKNESLAMLVIGTTLGVSAISASMVDMIYNGKSDSGYKQRRIGYIVASNLSASLIGAELFFYNIYRKREQSWIGHESGGSSQ